MISKEIMKRGGILSRLVKFKEESPYKPDSVENHHPSRSVITYRFKQPTRWLVWAHSNATCMVLLQVGFT